MILRKEHRESIRSSFKEHPATLWETESLLDTIDALESQLAEMVDAAILNALNRTHELAKAKSEGATPRAHDGVDYDQFVYTQDQVDRAVDAAVEAALRRGARLLEPIEKLVEKWKTNPKWAGDIRAANELEAAIRQGEGAACDCTKDYFCEYHLTHPEAYGAAQPKEKI